MSRARFPVIDKVKRQSDTRLNSRFQATNGVIAIKFCIFEKKIEERETRRFEKVADSMGRSISRSPRRISVTAEIQFQGSPQRRD